METTTADSRGAALLADFAGPDATFRTYQLAAVRDLVDDRARAVRAADRLGEVGRLLHRDRAVA